jgi:hypothetical protein
LRQRRLHGGDLLLQLPLFDGKCLDALGQVEQRSV